MKNEKKMKGIIFDFWGTLVENGTYSPIKQTFKILNVRMPFSAFVEKFERIFMTKKYASKAEAFKAVCKGFNLDCNDSVIEKLIGLWNKNMLLAKPYDETEIVLKGLKEKGIKLALAPNAPEQSIEPILEKFNLAQYFDVIMFSFEEGLIKTDKAFFEKAAKKLGLDKKDVMVVGDSIQSDIKGAENAGIKAILMDRNNRRDFKEKITALSELMEMV